MTIIASNYNCVNTPIIYNSKKSINKQIMHIIYSNIIYCLNGK